MLTPAASRRENWRASAQDMAKGRPTEIDDMNGHVVAQGHTCGVATRVSEATIEVIHEIERVARKQAPENIGVTLKRAACRDSEGRDMTRHSFHEHDGRSIITYT